MQRSIESNPHHPVIESIVSALCTKTQNHDRPFFRTMVCYFIGKMAGSQRCMIRTKDRGIVPVNIYAMSLATSGAGKGHSIALLENEFIGGFKNRFVNDTFPTIAKTNLERIALDRSTKNNTVMDEELERVNTEFSRLGALPFTFDSGTAPAVKQLRYKLMMANCGAINFQVDEIGSNLVSSEEVLNVFLELFDQGLVKSKLTKNTNDNQRGEDLDGKTPANMLLFGTPANLLNGSKTEEAFYSMLEIGYARRCIFAYGHRHRASETMTPEQIYRQLSDPALSSDISKWSNHCTQLADTAMSNWIVDVDDDVGIELMTYKVECEALADTLPEIGHESRKAEISHRYFKALKLAGALAFFDQSSDVTMDHLYYAMKITEESGEAFERIFTREKPYAKLAKYLASVPTEQTQADLTEALPFYRGSQSARNEMMTLATAYGYKNHIIIKKNYEQGIEFFQGKTLKETSLDQMILSYSQHVAYNYKSERAPFDKLSKLTSLSDYHWVNHALVNGDKGEGHRQEDNCIPGFNMIVVDIDSGASLDWAKSLLKEYTFLIHTTKRHSPAEERFRLILPINYELELSAEDYKEFMANACSWLPFAVDSSTHQRSRKWLTHPGEHFYNEGKLLDALPFIPKTSKNEEHKANSVKLENLDNLERWFAVRMTQGNRNNNMLRYALALVDSGMTYMEIEQKVLDFNAKLDTKLPVDELRQTVLKTVATKLHSNP